MAIWKDFTNILKKKKQNTKSPHHTNPFIWSTIQTKLKYNFRHQNNGHPWERIVTKSAQEGGLWVAGNVQIFIQLLIHSIKNFKGWINICLGLLISFLCLSLYVYTDTRRQKLLNFKMSLTPKKMSFPFCYYLSNLY